MLQLNSIIIIITYSSHCAHLKRSRELYAQIKERITFTMCSWERRQVPRVVTFLCRKWAEFLKYLSFKNWSSWYGEFTFHQLWLLEVYNTESVVQAGGLDSCVQNRPEGEGNKVRWLFQKIMQISHPQVNPLWAIGPALHKQGQYAQRYFV